MTELNERLDKQLSKVRINEEDRSSEKIYDAVFKKLYNYKFKLGSHDMQLEDEEFNSYERWLAFYDKREMAEDDPDPTIVVDITFPLRPKNDVHNDDPDYYNHILTHSKKVKPSVIEVEISNGGSLSKKMDVSIAGKSVDQIIREVKSAINTVYSKIKSQLK